MLKDRSSFHNSKFHFYCINICVRFVKYSISHDKKNIDYLDSIKYKLMISGLPLFPALAKSSFSIEEDAKSCHDGGKWKN